MIRRDCINEWYTYFKIQGHCSISFVLKAVVSSIYYIMVLRSDILFPRPNATHEGHCERVTQPLRGHDNNNSLWVSFMTELRRAAHVQLRASLVSGFGLNSATAFSSNQLNFHSLYEGRDRKCVSWLTVCHVRKQNTQKLWNHVTKLSLTDEPKKFLWAFTGIQGSLFE